MAPSNMKPRQHIIQFLKNNFFSIFALVVSFSSAYFSIKSYRDTVTQQAIDNTYKTFYDISVAGMDHSDLIHLCTMPESYDLVQKEIHLSLMPITEKKRAEYLLRERAFANYLFGFYENILLQYDESVKNRNTDKSEFLHGILDYLRDKVLRNPRLLYLWDSHGGKLSTNYAEATIDDYNENVLKSKNRSLTMKIDSVGPYFLDTAKVSY